MYKFALALFDVASMENGAALLALALLCGVYDCCCCCCCVEALIVAIGLLLLLLLEEEVQMSGCTVHTQAET